MNIHILYLLLLSSFFSLSNCQKIDEPQFIAFDSDKIKYEGRIGYQDSTAAELYWSGTSVAINFEGTTIKARLKDDNGDNYFNIILDEDSVYMLRMSERDSVYTLADLKTPGKHKLELFKRTEFPPGKTLFYGFELDNGTKLLEAPETSERKIEFYGNSITAGYAVHDYSPNDSPDSIYTDNYVSYAHLTAEHFDAEYSCICKSGIGIMISWFPYIMPELYDRQDPNDTTSLWDFSQYDPDIVVVNLFQNDSWLVNMPEHEEFKRVFGTEAPDEEYIINSYRNFVKTIRDKYPDADIICMLGTMDITREGSPWPGYVEKAVSALEDKKIYTHFVPFKNTPGHPRVEEQEVMAKSLIRFIEENIEW